MAYQRQSRRGTTIEHATFTGAPGEVTVDTTQNIVVVHDGITAGGHPGATKVQGDKADTAVQPGDLGTAAATDASAYATAAQGAKADDLGTIATQDADDVAITGGTADGLDIGPDAQLDDPFSMMPIGMTFSVPDHLTGADVPSNSGTRKYIKLTAGLTGAGEFNEGLLTNESVSGSAPEVVATAEIVGGPMDGETIHLLNSMGAFIRPGTTSGVFQQDQFQGHSHRHQNIRTSGSSGWSPTLQLTDAVDNDSGTTTGTKGPDGYGGNGTPRVGTETRPKNVSETFYRRII